MVSKMLYLLFFVLLFFKHGMAIIPSIQEYFPDLADDLTQINWMHATNSKERLEKALENQEFHMLEADIILGHLKGNSNEVIPIMAHPPINSSDLSLKTFLETVIAYQKQGKKGIKLDFKQEKAYHESWEILIPLQDQFTFPVWINADILNVSEKSFKPLNALPFFSRADEALPGALLSIGWTFPYYSILGSYRKENMDGMKNLIYEGQVKRPVTFAIRANFASHSKDLILDLVTDVSNYQGNNRSTVTFWSARHDIVNLGRLKQLITELGKERTVLDVPKNMMISLRKS